MRPFAFARADSVERALECRRGEPTGAFVAGGTTLLDLVKLDVMRPARVIDINALPLKDVERLHDDRLRIGALVTNTDLAYHPDVLADHPLLSQAILAGASSQVRNMATVGGNLMQRTRCPYFRDPTAACNKREPGSGCDALTGVNRMHAVLGGSDRCVAVHPSDMCVALAAIGATLSLQGPNGEREVDVADFHRLPGATPHLEHELGDELIVAVTLAPPLKPLGAAYVKLRDRASYEFALASAGAMLSLDEDLIGEQRLPLGGVATKPWRCHAAEALLAGKRADTAAFEEAADLALADAAPLAHNAFKIPLARQAIVRALRDAARAHREDDT
ncbi:FAD binding domain-containing protein [Halomonas beimenensis]|uniref:Periplasmic aromatic aldehyde oxidoreductase, FAD binding subunit YagS n=1 Tax=Halomonas beimenensis TaxID=475662 RepID=A0A291P6F1_9GAMM|nr:xanthine dehydrogenase family protein subunit M [Halomonas beimenensis]ATJ82448.1 periplasmic aromatic aldehyde oxidoreductase, FAD binding subunit YagS [Halomonas beimenensis]